MMFIEASAKTREGVMCAFEELVEKIIQTPTLWEMTDDQRKKNGLRLADGGQEAPGYMSSCGC
jgi:Ras-related protein Rab-18